MEAPSKDDKVESTHETKHVLYQGKTDQLLYVRTETVMVRQDIYGNGAMVLVAFQEA
jgi:hypothetical protein